MIDLNWTLLPSVAIFLITLFVLNRLLFRSLFRILDERRARTAHVRQQTQDTLKRFQSLLEQYEERIREQKERGYKLAESVRGEALREQQATISEARSRAEELGREARDQIHEELTAAQTRLKREAKEIAPIIVARILGRV